MYAIWRRRLSRAAARARTAGPEIAAFATVVLAANDDEIADGVARDGCRCCCSCNARRHIALPRGYCDGSPIVFLAAPPLLLALPEVLSLDDVVAFLLRLPVSVRTVTEPRIPNDGDVNSPIGEAPDAVAESYRRSIGDIPPSTAAIVGVAGAEGVRRVSDTDGCVFSSSIEAACLSIKLRIGPGLRVMSLSICFAGTFTDRLGESRSEPRVGTSFFCCSAS